MQLLSALYRPGTLVADPTHVHCWSQAGFRRELRRWVDIERDEGGNIQSLTLPWGNRFKTARLCLPGKDKVRLALFFGKISLVLGPGWAPPRSC